jgi:hypothetical protein
VEEITGSPSSSIAEVQAPSSFKYVMFPVDHNQFTIRLENIGDRFDTKPFGLSPAQTTVTVNLTDMVHEIFHVANPTGFKINQINFTEVTLTGNQQYQQSVA